LWNGTKDNFPPMRDSVARVTDCCHPSSADTSASSPTRQRSNKCSSRGAAAWESPARQETVMVHFGSEQVVNLARDDPGESGMAVGDFNADGLLDFMNVTTDLPCAVYVQK